MGMSAVLVLPIGIATDAVDAYLDITSNPRFREIGFSLFP